MEFFTRFLKGKMKVGGVMRLLLLVFGMVFFVRGNAATYYSIASGNWNATSTWSTISHAGAAATAVPTSTDIVLIGAHTVTVTADVATTGSRLGALTFDVSGGSVSVNSGITLWLSTVVVNHIAATNVSSTFSGSGTVNVGTGVTIGSDILKYQNL